MLDPTTTRIALGLVLYTAFLLMVAAIALLLYEMED